MQMQYATYTNIGDCSINEDTVAVFDKGKIKGFLLADGLGGHGGGDIASSHVASVVKEIVEKADSLDDKLLDTCFVTAQTSLLDLQKKTKSESSLKTTMVLLLTDGVKYSFAHIGDSRLYFINKGKIKFVTPDHSVPYMMLKMGKIKPEDVRHHPERNILLKVMGTAWTDKAYEIDKSNITAENGDMFLLCSDGFWEWIDDDDIEKLANMQADAESIISQMGTYALKKGMDKPSARDNLSAVFVKVYNVL